MGGAVGDALGAPVEFMSLREIRARFGPGGIRDYRPAYGRIGAITDDTQMTLFTAEGLLRADNRYLDRGICHVPTVVYGAYLRWLETQGIKLAHRHPDDRSGWLFSIRALHSRRAPGNTCLSALSSGRGGTFDRPINSSKGCGGVMRVSPVGLINAADTFRLGCETAAITHGHPTGYLAAGYFASTVAHLLRGEELEDALLRARETLRSWRGHEECLAAVDQAMKLARTAPPSPETVESLGEGFVAEESLAISVYCALTAKDFEHGVVLAVNHSGDSDSTGSLTGSLLGTLWGKSAIPERWLEALELRTEIEQIAADLWRHFGEGGSNVSQQDDWDRYPGC